MRRVKWTGFNKWFAVRTILSLSVLAIVVLNAFDQPELMFQWAQVILPVCAIASTLLLAVIAIPTAPDD